MNINKIIVVYEKRGRIKLIIEAVNKLILIGFLKVLIRIKCQKYAQSLTESGNFS